MHEFLYTSLPSRVVFGAGTIDRLGDELRNLGVERPLVLATPQQSSHGQMIAEILGSNISGVFFEAMMHTPVEVTERALTHFDSVRADSIVAVGGGSTIGLGKAIALRNDAPQIVLPTTYAGSEMTTIIGQTEGGMKTTQKSLKVLPETVIYDVDLTLGLPVGMSVTSGINAIAHAVEALYAENQNPIQSMIAETGVSALYEALWRILEEPHDVEARSDATYGAWLCGICLGTAGVALHHKLCHVLGGSFNLPHAETHTVVLPHALSYNAPVVETAMAALRRATQSDDPAGALFDLAERSGTPMALRNFGMKETDVDRAVDIALKNPYWNPRPLEREGLRGIIMSAWAGDRPRRG